MADFMPLSPEYHARQGWHRFEGYDFASGDRIVPVVDEELPHLMPGMSTAFVRDGEGDAFRLVAIMGVQPGQNIFVRPDGRWLAGYVPALYRAWPFRLHRDGNGRLVLGLRRDSGLLRESPTGDSEERFFDDAGEMTPALARVANFLRQFERYRKRTQRAVDALAEQGLIEPWAVSLATGENNRRQQLDGLYRVTAQRLQGLDSDALSALHEHHALGVAWGQVYGQNRIQELPRLARLQQKMQKKMTGGLRLDDLFETPGAGSDGLTFDFSQLDDNDHPDPSRGSDGGP